MKVINTFLFCALLCMSCQILGAESYIPDAPIDEMPLGQTLPDGMTVFEFYKSAFELRDKPGTPAFEERRIKVIKKAEDLNKAEDSLDLAIEIYRFFDIEALFLPDFPLKDSLGNKLARLSVSNEGMFREVQKRYGTDKFIELLGQPIKKDDKYSIKIVDRFLARYQKFVDDRELRNKVLALKKSAKVN